MNKVIEIHVSDDMAVRLLKGEEVDFRTLDPALGPGLHTVKLIPMSTLPKKGASVNAQD